MQRYLFIFGLLTLLALCFFLIDIALGSVYIPIDAIGDILSGEEAKKAWKYIVLYFRIPKAITALFVGAGISVAGLQMQTLFHNPLADTSILGIGHGASLGVAILVMSSALFPQLIPTSVQNNYWSIVIVSIAGALLVLLVIATLANWMRDIVSLLLIGVMFGFITTAFIAILQYFSNPEIVKNYLVWTFGSLSGTTWNQLYILMPIVALGLFLSLLIPKSMNAILLGENYAKSVGVNVKKARLTLILLTGLITGTLTAFVGPIAFIGIAVPHVARLIFKTANNQILIPATLLLGIILMLICDIISQLPTTGVALPINSVTALLGAPIVIFIILQNRRNKSIFN